MSNIKDQVDNGKCPYCKDGVLKNDTFTLVCDKCKVIFDRCDICNNVITGKKFLTSTRPREGSQYCVEYEVCFECYKVYKDPDILKKYYDDKKVFENGEVNTNIRTKEYLIEDLNCLQGDFEHHIERISNREYMEKHYALNNLVSILRFNLNKVKDVISSVGDSNE